MCSGVGLAAAFDWDSERINYDSIRKYFDELEITKQLRTKTIFCDHCSQRLVIDNKLDGIVYCMCENHTATTIKTLEKPWKPYMERKNMIIWRREERSGLYAYKGFTK